MAHPSVRYMVVVSTIMLSLVACGDEDISENAARLRIKLTDSASPVVKELNFDIKAIEVYATDTVTNEGEWVPLAFEGGKYNLLALRNGKTVDLVDQYFPAGKRIEQLFCSRRRQQYSIEHSTRNSRGYCHRQCKFVAFLSHHFQHRHRCECNPFGA